MRELNVIVKREYNDSEDNIGYPIMFYIGYSRNKPVIECFTFQDGHNEACVDYLVSLWNCTKEEQQNFVESVQKYYDSLPGDNVKLVLKDVLVVK